jgi:hypothetical protein
MRHHTNYSITERPHTAGKDRVIKTSVRNREGDQWLCNLLGYVNLDKLLGLLT